MKYIFTSFIILLFLTSSVIAQESDLPDLYIKDISFSECVERDLEIALFNQVREYEVLNIADDGSYLDVKDKPHQYYPITSEIRRLACIEYTVGNKGTASVNSDYNSPEGTPRLYESLFTTNENWTNKGHVHYSFTSKSLEPGETYSDTHILGLTLNSNTENAKHCVGIEVEMKTGIKGDLTESDASNNKSTICFDIDEYDFPGKVNNVTATKSEGNILELTWDAVDGADKYEIRAQNVAPVKHGSFFLDDITTNKAVIEFPNEDLHWIYVNAVKDGIAGELSSIFSYGTLVRKFKDVPISSWYFPYIQDLQANFIMDGYKHANGYHTGYFGPADNITVAESLKVEFAANHHSVAKYRVSL